MAGRDVEELMDWTAKQGRILTANGEANRYYTAERGFHFSPDECPHHYLLLEEENDDNDENQSLEADSNNGANIFRTWAMEQHSSRGYNPVLGAFFRRLFVGEWEHSTNNDELTYNVQTNTLFVDIRIPRLGQDLFRQHQHQEGLTDMHYSNGQLQLFARRHAFGGFTRVNQIVTKDGNGSNRRRAAVCCTRHHCIDWNFCGTPRPRPNKWYVNMRQPRENMWKEYAFANNEWGNPYYFEQWERLNRDHREWECFHQGRDAGFVLALRKERNDKDSRDGILVAVGDHFNYIYERKLSAEDKKKKQKCNNYKAATSSVELIDAMLDRGDRALAEAYLSMDAGHGLISEGWIIDCALQPWKEGSSFMTTEKGRNSNDNNISVEGSSVITNDGSCRVVINGCAWSVYECSHTSVEALEYVLEFNAAKAKDPNYSNKHLEHILFGTANEDGPSV